MEVIDSVIGSGLWPYLKHCLFKDTGSMISLFNTFPLMLLVTLCLHACAVIKDIFEGLYRRGSVTQLQKAQNKTSETSY